MCVDLIGSLEGLCFTLYPIYEGPVSAQLEADSLRVLLWSCCLHGWVYECTTHSHRHSCHKNLLGQFLTALLGASQLREVKLLLLLYVTCVHII